MGKSGFLWTGNPDNFQRRLNNLKTLAGKRQPFGKQLTDVKNLIRNDFGAAYIEKRAQKLNVFDLFEQCRKEIEE